MPAFTIDGVVLDAETRRPLGGWYVAAYAGDGTPDDVFGAAVTSEDGTFTIHADARDPGELSERHREVCFRVAPRPGEGFVHASGSGEPAGGEAARHHEILVPRGAPVARAPGDSRGPRRSGGGGRPG